MWFEPQGIELVFVSDTLLSLVFFSLVQLSNLSSKGAVCLAHGDIRNPYPSLIYSKKNEKANLNEPEAALGEIYAVAFGNTLEKTWSGAETCVLSSF